MDDYVYSETMVVSDKVLEVSGVCIVGSNCVISGHGNKIIGSRCTVRGSNNNIHGSHSIVIGNGNRVVGDNNTINGDRNEIKGICITVQGVGNHGTFNKMFIAAPFDLVASNEPSAPPPDEPERDLKFVEGPKESELQFDVIAGVKDNKCVICLDNEGICVVLKCLHRCLCVKCSRVLCFGNDNQLKLRGQVKCPVCRENTKSIKRIH